MYVTIINTGWIELKVNWIFILVYVAVAIISARVFYSAGFEEDYKDSLKKGITDETRLKELATRYGLFCSWGGLVWPLAWPVLGAIYFLTRVTDFEKKLKAEKEAKEFSERVEKEKQRLREWFMNESMVTPDDETLTKIAKENLSK